MQKKRFQDHALDGHRQGRCPGLRTRISITFFSGFVMLHWQRLVEVEPWKMFKFGYVLNVSYTT